MKVTKLGHCCMIIEENGVRILTDPGAWTTSQLEVRDIHVILITHEHADHFHLNSLKTVLLNNPTAVVFTNKSVGSLLEKEGIPFQLLDDGAKETVKGVKMSGHGNEHATIYPLPGAGPVENTGFLIQEKFFYPGDALIKPPTQVEILALPVAGPWMKVSEAIEYMKDLQPRITFPVHDGMIKPVEWLHNYMAKICAHFSIDFEIVENGKENEW